MSSIAAVMVGSMLVCSPAQSRIWSHSAADLSRDYLVITDNRGGAENVFVFWMASAMLPPGAQTQALRDILSKYVVLGVSHSHVSKEGSVSFDTVSSLEADDGSGQSLSVLSTDTMPPVVVGTLAGVQAAMSRSFGAFGKGIQWFVFDAGSVQVCGKGEIAVKFAAQVYTFDTPIPGCQ